MVETTKEASSAAEKKVDEKKKGKDDKEKKPEMVSLSFSPCFCLYVHGIIGLGLLRSLLNSLDYVKKQSSVHS